MAFKGRGGDPETAKDNQEAIYKRPLTWCDVFYMATVEATKDKHVLITRFPIFHMKTVMGLWMLDLRLTMVVTMTVRKSISQ